MFLRMKNAMEWRMSRHLYNHFLNTSLDTLDLSLSIKVDIYIHYWTGCLYFRGHNKLSIPHSDAHSLASTPWSSGPHHWPSQQGGPSHTRLRPWKRKAPQCPSQSSLVGYQPDSPSSSKHNPDINPSPQELASSRSVLCACARPGRAATPRSLPVSRAGREALLYRTFTTLRSVFHGARRDWDLGLSQRVLCWAPRVSGPSMRQTSLCAAAEKAVRTQRGVRVDGEWRSPQACGCSSRRGECLCPCEKDGKGAYLWEAELGCSG